MSVKERSPLTQMKDSLGASRRVSIVGGTPTLLAGIDKDRVCLIISSHPSNSLQLFFGVGSSSVQGMLLPANSLPFVLTLEQHGGLVRGQISGFSGSSFDVQVWEAWVCECKY